MYTSSRSQTAYNSNMDATLLYSSFALLFLILYWLRSRTALHKNLPPSPPSLPILGHIHLISQPLHRSLHNLSQKYGPIISLKLGPSWFVVVVSSPSAVQECFTKNDVVLANRPVLAITNYFDYNPRMLVTSPYSDHWRKLRRLCNLEIFSPGRLNVFLDTRRNEVKILLQKLYRVSSSGYAKVELGQMFRDLSFNIIMQMVSGNRYFGEDVTKNIEEANQFREVIGEAFKHADTSYIGDFLPILQWFDYKGFLKTVQQISKKTNVLLQGLIDEHRSLKGGLESRNTMISHLLSLQESEPESYSDEIIKGLILNMIFAGTDTSAVTLEWAMSSLLNHPEVLKKAKVEIDSQIGQENQVDESDLSNLPYLQNIISETLRLYPAAPLLVPHLSSNDSTLGGYNVPANTMLLVNAWAIQRDPKLWEDADMFKPERFENESAIEGCNKFMPFGLGRRACPGMGLANRVVGLGLASLIQCFDWKRESEKKVDMTEGNGLTMPKAEPLVAMCRARDFTNKFL